MKSVCLSIKQKQANHTRILPTGLRLEVRGGRLEERLRMRGSGEWEVVSRKWVEAGEEGC